MKILLLGINARYTHVNLALYYLGLYIDPAKHETVLIERTINDSIDDVIAEIAINDPDVLCLSVYIWNNRYIQSILKDIKKINEDLIIVCGGPDISWNSNKWIEDFPSIDYIISGVGERGFEILCQNDFVYPQKIVDTDNYHFSQIKMPYSEKDLANFAHRYVYYEASRGCVCNCSYCISSIDKTKVEPISDRHIQKVEYKSFEKIKEDLLFILSSEPIIIKFIDRSFNANNSLCLEIWNFLSILNTSTKFHFEVHPLFINEEQIEVLKSIPKGRFQLEVGIQTIHDNTLNLIDRKGSWEIIRGSLKKLSSLVNIHLHYDMLVGLPGESLHDVFDSFSEIIKFLPDHFQIGFLKVLPGTKIHTEVEKYGYNYQEEAPYKILSSNTLSYSDILIMSNLELVIDLLYNANIMKTLMLEIIQNIPNFKDFFLELKDCFIANNVHKNTTNRQILFKIVMDNITTSNIIPQKSFFIDCLRYDWFVSQETHFYPEFISSERTDLFKERNYKSFKEDWQKTQKGEYKLKLKNAIFFSPEDEYFREKYLNRAEGAVKVNNEFYYIKKRD